MTEDVKGLYLAHSVQKSDSEIFAEKMQENAARLRHEWFAMCTGFVTLGAVVAIVAFSLVWK